MRYYFNKIFYILHLNNSVYIKNTNWDLQAQEYFNYFRRELYLPIFV